MKAFAPSTLLLLTLASGCASPRGGLVLDRVGPASDETGHNSHGTLTVYSDLDSSPHWGNPNHIWYSDYQVLSDNGDLLKTVRNDSGTTVEGPVKVQLAPGNYRVHARANRYGWVTVPILIEANRVTTVHLDSGSDFRGLAASNSVLLPHGETVGCRAPDTNPSQTPQQAA